MPPALPTSAKPSSARRTSASSATGRSSRSSSCLRSARPAARAALPETKVWREADDLPASAVRSVSPITWSHAGQRQADGVGEHLRHDRRGALADLLRAVVEEEMGAVRGVAAQRAAHRRRIGDHGVADAVPHAGDAGAAAQRPSRRRRLGIERLRRRARRHPRRPQRIETFAQADARLEPLPGGRAVAGAQGVAMAELERDRRRTARRARRSAARRAAPPAARRSRGRRRRRCCA